MRRAARIFPWVILFLGVVYLVGKMIPEREEGEMELGEFGKISLVFQGRVKPYDTIARNSLMILSDRQTFADAEGDRQPAIKWLLDVIANSPEAREHAVFRIDNHEVLDVLGLEPRSGLRYSLSEINTPENIEEISRHAQAAGGKPTAERGVFDNKILELHRKMQLYHRLAGAHELLNFDRIESREQLTRLLQRYRNLSETPLPYAIPPGDGAEDWQPLMMARLRETVDAALDPGMESHPAVRRLTAILAAYRLGEAERFNAEVAGYLHWQKRNLPDETKKAGFEVFFNHFAPFYRCSVLYLGVFVLAAFGWLGWPRPMNRAAFWLAVLTLLVHTFAMAGRVYLQGRPPVTNLYSSAIFVAWGAVVFALIVERIYRNGLGTTMAATLGFTSLLVAHNLAGDGDTLEVLQAVLDTNFWLATHVTAMTLSYSATFMAGFLGAVLVLGGVFSRSLTSDRLRTLGRMIYGIICFALLLGFTGTVLGGIWADQSWGRFWGWDPKENGALMIVLWLALILHARWGGLVRERGLAVLGIFGNILVAWSWFGTNMLGVGLHSYGFTDSAFFWLLVFVFSQLLLMGLGLVPTRMWRSSAAYAKRSGTASPCPSGVV